MVSVSDINMEIFIIVMVFKIMILDKMIKSGSTGKKIVVIEPWALRDQ